MRSSARVIFRAADAVPAFKSKFHVYGMPSFSRMRTTHVGEDQEFDTSTGQPSPIRTDVPSIRAYATSPLGG
jgi:hypothetical protein